MYGVQVVELYRDGLKMTPAARREFDELVFGGFDDGVQRLAEVLRVRKRQIDAVNGQRALDVGGKAQAKTQIDRYAMDTLTAIDTHWRVEWQRRKGNVGDVQTRHDAAWHAEAARVWARLKGQLDAGVDFSTLAENSNRMELEVLTEEAGAYLRSRQPNDPATAAHNADEVSKLISLSMVRFFTPDEKRFYDAGRRLERASESWRTSLAHARWSIEADDPLVVLAGLGGEPVTV